MATSIVNKTTGEDYTTLTLWESSKGGNLSGESRQETAHVYADKGALDDRFSISGNTTSASYYMKAIGVSTEANKTYTWDSAKVRIQPSTNGDVISIFDEYSEIGYFQILPGTGANGTAIVCDTGSDYAQIYYNIIDGQESTSVGGIYVAAGGNHKIYRNVIWGTKRSFFGGLRCVTTSAVNIYQNTFYNNYYGVRCNGATQICRGNACFNNTENFNGTFDTTNSGYNGTNSASGAPGSNNVHSLTASTEFTSVSAGSENFAITNAGSLYNSGGSTPGSPYDVDVQGNAWNSSIGADNYATSNQSDGVPSKTLSFTKFAPIDKMVGNTKDSIPSKSLSLTSFAPIDKLIGVTREGIPNRVITLTSFAPSDKMVGKILEPVPSKTLTLTSFAPGDLLVSPQAHDAIPQGVLNLTTYAPLDKMTGTMKEPINLGFLTLTSFAPIDNLYTFVPVVRGGGGRPSKPKLRRVVIDGKLYTVEEKEVYSLLLKFIDQKQTELIQEQVKLEPSRRKIKILKQQITKLETKVEDLEEEWDEEILLMIA